MSKVTELKRCITCRQEQPLDNFYPYTKGGVRADCKDCSRKSARAWRLANPARRSVHNRKYNKAHPEVYAAAAKRYARRHPEKIQARNELYNERHPEKIRASRMVRRAVELGQLIKPSSCENCGRESDSPGELDGHHADYSKPLDVEWLCRKCHIRRHLQERNCE